MWVVTLVLWAQFGMEQPVVQDRLELHPPTKEICLEEERKRHMMIRPTPPGANRAWVTAMCVWRARA